MRQSHWLWLGVAGATALFLSGCAGDAAFPAFGREATEQDAIPPDFALFSSAEEDHGLNLDTFRYVASHDAADLYLIASFTGSVCLFVAADEDSMMSCGGRGGQLGMSGPVGTFEVNAAPIGEKDGWTVLSENVRVQN